MEKMPRFADWKQMLPDKKQPTLENGFIEKYCPVLEKKNGFL